MTEANKGTDEFLKILEEIGEGGVSEGTKERLSSDGKLLLEVVYALNALQQGGAAAPELDRPTAPPVALEPELLLRGMSAAPAENVPGAPELEPPAPMSAEENAIRLARLLAEAPPEL